MIYIRFKQHNGILPVVAGSKIKEIKEYFSKNDRLGYTIFVKSPLFQPLTLRNKDMYESFAKQSNSPVTDLLNEQGIDDMKKTETILIESFRRNYGYFPPWNKMSGSIAGQNSAMKNNINIVKSFCSPDDYYKHPIVSRSTIRKLSANSEYAMYENFLHAVRMSMLTAWMDFHEALDFHNQHDRFGYFEKIKESGYSKKRLIV